MTTAPVTIRERIDLPPAPAASMAPSVQTPSITASDVFAVIRRRMLLIVFLFLFLSGLCGGAWYVGYQYYPLWPAESYVECISDRPGKSLEIVSDPLGQKEYDRFIMTQAQIVRSANVLFKALQTPEVRGTDWFKNTPADRRQIEFLELVNAAPQRGTNLLKISCETRSADDPQVIVNQVVRQYVNSVKEENTGDYREQLEARRNELSELEKQILAKQQQLSEIQRQLPPGVTTMNNGVAVQDYATQRQVVTELTVQVNDLRTLYDMYQQGHMGLSPEDSLAVEQDPQVALLANQVFSLNQNLEVSQKNFGPNHRHIKQLEESIDVVQRQLTQIRQERYAQRMDYNRALVETAFHNAQSLLLQAQVELADKEAILQDMDAKISEYQLVAEDITRLKSQRSEVDDAIKELDRVVKEQTAIRVEVRQPALKPLFRSFPKIFLLPAAAALSLVLAVSFALLIEFLDTSLRTPRDLVRHLQIPLLGMVPDADDEEVDIKHVETAVYNHPDSMFAEAFRSIRTNLQFTSTADRQRAIVVTSPRPEDGKTTAACNLALIIAQGGRRVLLVDANLRRPAIHRFFSVQPAGGLSNILVGDGQLEELVAQTALPNLDVLGSGPFPPNPAELMGSRQIQDFLAEATRIYDQVILDAPPVLLASDAGLLATRADGVILVCHANTNSRGVGMRACSMLSRVGAHVFGGILNAAQVRRGGYFREQLRTFYDYHGDEGGRGGKRRTLPSSEAHVSQAADNAGPHESDSPFA